MLSDYFPHQQIISPKPFVFLIIFDIFAALKNYGN